MKKLLTLTLAALLGCQLVSAEENADNGGYERILQDGRQWITITWGPVVMFDDVHMDRMTVIGDYVLNGVPCKKIEEVYSGETYETYGREENGKVYIYGYDQETGEEGFIPIMDISLNEGDELPIDDYISKVDYVTVNDITRKRLTIGYEANQRYWIEGIGANRRDAWGFIEQVFPTNSERTWMLGCYQDGGLIFDYADFNKKGHSGINRITMDETANGSESQIYDTNGIAVKKPQRGVIYFKDGKKFIMNK